jgi:hypothetical protein
MMTKPTDQLGTGRIESYEFRELKVVGRQGKLRTTSILIEYKSVGFIEPNDKLL